MLAAAESSHACNQICRMHIGLETLGLGRLEHDFEFFPLLLGRQAQLAAQGLTPPALGRRLVVTPLRRCVLQGLACKDVGRRTLSFQGWLKPESTREVKGSCAAVERPTSARLICFSATCSVASKSASSAARAGTAPKQYSKPEEVCTRSLNNIPQCGCLFRKHYLCEPCQQRFTRTAQARNFSGQSSSEAFGLNSLDAKELPNWHH